MATSNSEDEVKAAATVVDGSTITNPEDDTASGAAHRVPFTDKRARWHGQWLKDSWKTPAVVARSTVEARPGYNSRTATEYMDDGETLKSKVKEIAKLMRASHAVCVYTGAGISTAAGIGDYASKAAKSVAPHKTGTHTKSVNRLKLLPTYSHKALAALERRRLVHHWLQQNHDRLAQKAGYPQAKLNEIHGAWKDSKNRVLMMDERLRPDLVQWCNHWAREADMCIAMGTSICGMTADSVAQAVASRYTPLNRATPGQGQGLVIINLQQTPKDAECSIRVWGLIDDVMALLSKELNVPVPNPKCEAAGKAWQAKHKDCTYTTPTRKPTDPM